MPQTTARPSRKKTLSLKCATAHELMTPNPISISAISTLKRALAFLLDHHFSAAPVIDEAGRAVGVFSITDIVRHIKKQSAAKSSRNEYYDMASLALPDGGWFGPEAEGGDETEVRHVMTPLVFSVTPNTPASQVIEAMIEENVHRLFVVDDAGVLVGVISTFDILKRLG
jgi:CBS domain-containing protein